MRTFSVDPGIRYETPEERRQARRDTLNRRYESYKALCEELGLSTRGGATGSWSSHYAELRQDAHRAAAANAALLDHEENVYRRWWLLRFTLNEIHTLARGIA